MAQALVTRGFSTGSNTSSVAFIVRGGYETATQLIEWIGEFNGKLVTLTFNGVQVSQSYPGILKDELTLSAMIQSELYREAIQVSQIFDGSLVSQKFDGVIDT